MMQLPLPLLLVLLVLAADVVPESVHNDHIVAHISLEGRPPEPWLVPAHLLAKSHKDWPEEDQALLPHERLRKEIHARFDAVSLLPRERRRSCGFSISCGGERMPPDIRRRSIFEVAGYQYNVLVVEVIESEPAWSLRSPGICTLVHVKVIEVIRWVDPISEGDVLSYHLPWGVMELDGTTLCTLPDPPKEPFEQPQPPPRAGAKFLLLGNIEPGNTTFLDSSPWQTFEVIEEKVHYPAGFTYYQDNKPVSLDEIRKRLGR